MFTGLIETVGTVANVEKRDGSQRITIDAPEVRLRTGDSIAVSGVCLTAVEIDRQQGRFSADLAAETVARTSLSLLAAGSKVNLELPTPAGAPLGGHIVQGHVDGTGRLLDLAPIDSAADPAIADRWLRLTVPAELGRYMVPKGSIAVEGVSLTIARWKPEENLVEIAIIPHTYARTNLHSLEAGRLLNIEADVSLKFLEQRLRQAEFHLTTEYLIANGY